MNHRKSTIGVLCAIAAQLLFGLSFLFTKQITSVVTPMSLLSWRLVLAFSFMTICVKLGIFKVSYKGKDMRPLALLSLFQPVLYFTAETIGIQMTTASESGTIIACIPIATLIASTVFLKKAPTFLQILGVFISFCGIVIVVLIKGAEVSFNPVGYLVLLGAVVAAAMFTICSAKAEEFTSVEKTYVMAAFGAVVFTICALFENGIHGTLGTFLTLPFQNIRFLASVLYLSLGCSVLAFIMTNVSIANIGANRLTSFSGLTTVGSIVAGVVLLDESFSWLQGGGTVLVLLGMYLANATFKGKNRTLDSQKVTSEPMADGRSGVSDQTEVETKHKIEAEG